MNDLYETIILRIDYLKGGVCFYYFDKTPVLHDKNQAS